MKVTTVKSLPTKRLTRKICNKNQCNDNTVLEAMQRTYHPKKYFTFAPWVRCMMKNKGRLPSHNLSPS